MARFRYEPQRCVEMSTAALSDGRLRRGSALHVYALGIAVDGISVDQVAKTLKLTEQTVDATLAYLCRAGWAIDLGDEHLFLDRPVEVGRNGEIKESDYAIECLRYALGLTGSGNSVRHLSPEERRREFRLIRFDQETRGM